MTEVTKETITTQDNNEQTVIASPVRIIATHAQKIEYVVYFFFGAVEVALAFRLVLKLMGASISSFFVRVVYTLTSIFVLPFEGIFRKGFTQGIETTSILEPSTVVAIFVYIVLAWGIVRLVRISSGEQQQTE